VYTRWSQPRGHGGLSGESGQSGAHLLDAVFSFGFSDHLPLHVAGRIEPATLQRDDVIDDIADAGASELSGRQHGCRHWNSRRAADDRGAVAVRLR